MSGISDCLESGEPVYWYLQVVEIECKGRGVVASRPFKKGEFVVEYAGDLVDLGVAKQRENSYSVNQHVGCYMYYFQHRDKNYW